MIPNLQKPASRAAERHAKAIAKMANYRKVCAAVDRRDDYHCRACGMEIRKTPSRIGHHHHVRFRSKGGNDASSNIVLLCGRCHDELHAYRLSIVELTTLGADGELKFKRLRVTR